MILQMDKPLMLKLSNYFRYPHIFNKSTESVLYTIERCIFMPERVYFMDKHVNNVIDKDNLYNKWLYEI